MDDLRLANECKAYSEAYAIGICNTLIYVATSISPWEHVLYTLAGDHSLCVFFIIILKVWEILPSDVKQTSKHYDLIQNM